MSGFYAGPPRWQLPDLMEKQRHIHDEAMYQAWLARFYGRRADHVVAMRAAQLARLELRYLKICQRALDSRPTERVG